MTILYIFIFIGVILGILWSSKASFKSMREGTEKLSARVVEYRNEKGPMRNDYTKLSYPYVEIEKSPSRLIRLKYACSASKHFKLNETISVF